VGDQRLVRAQFEREFVAQEPCQLVFDVLGFGLRPGEPQEVIADDTLPAGSIGSMRVLIVEGEIRSATWCSLFVRSVMVAVPSSS
jgi:hypothetical protein